MATVGNGGHKVLELVDEAVLPAENMARRPPLAGVRVARTGNKRPGEPVDRAAPLVQLQLVEALEVEAQAAARPVELDHQRVIAAGRHPGRFQGRQRPPAQAGQHGTGIVDGDRAGPALPVGRGAQPGARAAQRPLADKGLEHGHDLVDLLAGEEPHQVDDMRQKVAQRPGTGLGAIEPPGEREQGVDQPTLEIDGADVA